METIAEARKRLLKAWADHEDFGTRLTRKYQALIDKFYRECKYDENGHAIGEPRKPSIGINEGVRETEALVAASEAYADALGVHWVHFCQQKGELRRQGLSKEAVLDSIEADPASCHREPDFWGKRPF